MPQIPLFAHFRNIIRVYSEKKEEYELDKYTSMGYNNRRAGNSLGYVLSALLFFNRRRALYAGLAQEVLAQGQL
jgi:hypothetical protein